VKERVRGPGGEEGRRRGRERNSKFTSPTF